MSTTKNRLALLIQWPGNALDDRGIVARCHVIARDNFLLQGVKPSPVSRLASQPKNTSPGTIQPVHESNQSPPSSTELRMNGAFLHSAACLRGLHRNNYKFYQACPIPTLYTVLLLCMFISCLNFNAFHS
jgi:hypothetical protein